MTICCSRCDAKEKIPCNGISDYEIQKEAHKLGWYINPENKVLCKECIEKQRGFSTLIGKGRSTHESLGEAERT